MSDGGKIELIDKGKKDEIFPYLPHTDEDRKWMMNKIGVESIEQLFQNISPDLKLKQPMGLDAPRSEMEIIKTCKKLSQMNKGFEDLTCFLGAGYYDHYVPAVVDHILLRSEFYTAYTPYQAEISQGYLQAIFEYQTMICELTGMDISNASMYDGPTSTAEAGVMAVNATKRYTILISKTVHPDIREVCKTYWKYAGINLVEVEYDAGSTDAESLENSLDSNVAGVILQYPNFFGIIEDLQELSGIIKDNGSLFIVNADPISLGMLKSPGQIGADIVVGEAASLGNPINFGGPGLGYFTAKERFLRRMPGRIVGQTTDGGGNRGFALTLQTREQHIRRQRATSNICSNHALNALAAAVYLTIMGRAGIKEVAEQAFKKSHYLMESICSLEGFDRKFDDCFFKEFVVRTSKDIKEVLRVLEDNGILGGYPLKKYYPELSDCFMVAVTEKRTREEMNNYIDVLEGIIQ